MQIIKKIVLYTLFIPIPVMAQVPTPVANAPSISTSFGYSYVSLDASPSSRVMLNGAEASATVDFRPRLGAKVDVGYVRASNVLGSDRHSDVLSYLVGPVLYYSSRHKRLRTYVQALVGGARVTGPVPLSRGAFATGFVNKLSWGGGGGLEYELSGPFAFRVGSDYIHTAFFSPTLIIRGQNDIRSAVSVVYLFGGRSTRSR
jgi:hypothetical protein